MPERLHATSVAGGVQTAALDSSLASRLRQPLSAALLTAAWWIVLQGFNQVFVSGPWTGHSLLLFGTAVGSAALFRALWPQRGTLSGVVGVVIGLGLLTTSVDVRAWIGGPSARMQVIRLHLFDTAAPAPVILPLEELLLAATLLVAIAAVICLAVDWAVLAGVLVALPQVGVPAVIGMRLPGWTLAATGAVLALLIALWAPRRASRLQGIGAVALALGVAATVFAGLPLPRDRVWNDQAVAVSPVVQGVPDVTVTLANDLRRGSEGAAFEYRGVMIGNQMRFPLAVLTDFDGGTWHPDDTFDPAGRDISQPQSTLVGDAPETEEIVDRLNQSNPVSITILGLVSDRLPLGQGTYFVRAPATGDTLDLSQWTWIEGSQTARSATAITKRGQQYEVYADPLMVGTEDRRLLLYSDFLNDPPAGMERYTALSGEVPAVLTDTAKEVTVGAESQMEAAMDLVDWFRGGGFSYDITAPYTPGSDPADPYQVMVSFLDQRRGFCVHFASTFAVMARSLGIPTRLVVGYASTAHNGWTAVRGSDLHAWPEVYVDHIGWVALEPTPGIGEAAPEPAAEPSPTPSEQPTPQPTPEPTSSNSASSADSEQSGADSGAGLSSGSVSGWAGGLALLLLIAVLPAAARLLRTRMRLRAIRRGRQPATRAWQELLDTAADLRLPVASRAYTPEAMAEALGAGEDLATAVVAERFSGEPQIYAQAEADLAAQCERLRSRATPRGRLIARLLPRSLWRPE